MTATTDHERDTTTFAWIEHQLIEPNLDNVRHSVTPDRELADSIKEHGVLEPLIVHAHPDDEGRYVLIAGHRRHAAAGTIKPAPAMPCIVRAAYANRAELVAAMLTENLHRADLSPVEEAEAYEVMALEGLSDKDIAGLAKKPTTRVRARRKLLKLDESLQERLHTGQMTLDQAAAFITHAGDRQAIRDLTKALESGDLSAWRWQLEQAEQRATRRAERAKVVKDLRAEGVRVVEPADMPDGWRPGMWPDPYEVSYRHHNGLPSTRAEHEASDCDQLVAKLTTGAYPEWYCLDPTLHGAPDPQAPQEPHGTPTAGTGVPAGSTASTESTVDTAAVQEARAQAQRDLQDCETAAALRRKHVAAFVRGTTELTDEMREAITSYVAETLAVVYLEAAHADILEWLGVEADVEDSEEAEQLVTRTLRGLPGHQALLAVIAAADESGQQGIYRWSPTYLPNARGWLRLLGGPLGYEWSRWELDKFQAAGFDPASTSGAGDDPDLDGDARPVEDVDVREGVL